MELNKVKANKNGQINHFIKVNGFKIKCMVMEHIPGKTAENMKGNGCMEKWTDKEFLFSKKIKYMKDILNKEIGMGKVR